MFILRLSKYISVISVCTANVNFYNAQRFDVLKVRTEFI